MLRILALLALLASVVQAPCAAAASREVEVTGHGLTAAEAITDGLVQALAQVRGMQLASITVARGELATQVKGDEKSRVLTQSHQTATVRATGGYISAYRVLSMSDGAPVSAELAVTVEVYEPAGLSPDTRRRIAVMAFAAVESKDKRPSAIPELLRDRITAHLVQTRRFAVVDRSQDAAYVNEMSLLASGNVPLAERSRLGQMIGADYIVTGKLRQTAATRSDRTIGLTGEVVTTATAGSAEADYQVIEIATRQIKWAATAKISGEAALDTVGTRIAEEITQTIYPMRLIRFSDPGNLIVNQGGDGLHAGQRFRAMVMGEALIDPYSKESLGQAEEEAGIIEIKRVDPKVSYAQLVSGRLPAPSGDDVQIVLRPALPAAVKTAPRAAARPAAPAITKLPYDQ